MDVKSRPVSISNTYKNKPEYKSVESKVDKSILPKERYYISGHDKYIITIAQKVTVSV